MKTRDRILYKSLEMFNDQGEPNVSTNHIADELEISPGNLYYHFRNKDDIVEHLFAMFEKRLSDVLFTTEERSTDLEDIWLQLHLIFECIWEYRFIYRDLVDLTARHRKLRTHFSRLIKRETASAEAVLRGLVRSEVMTASEEEIKVSAIAIVQTTTFWMSFRSVSSGTPGSSEDLANGVYHVMMLVAPFLRDPERSHLGRLAQAYLP